jgi:type II secretory pathway component PulJ
MKTDHRKTSNPRGGYTIPDLLVGATVCAVLSAGMFTTISALRKSARASEHHAQCQVQQARLIDYMSRDLRRALSVSVDADQGGERLKLTIPDYYDASGGPREPIIDGSGVRYGSEKLAITYYKSNDSVYRAVNGMGTVLASGLEKFEIDYTDDGQQAVTVAISFIPRFQYDEADAATARAGTATFATTLLRNKRQ